MRTGQFLDKESLTYVRHGDTQEEAVDRAYGYFLNMTKDPAEYIYDDEAMVPTQTNRPGVFQRINGAPLRMMGSPGH